MIGTSKIRTLLLAAAIAGAAAAAQAAQTTTRIHFKGHGVVTYAQGGDFYGPPVAPPVAVGDPVSVGGNIWYPGDLVGQSGKFVLKESQLFPRPGWPAQAAFAFNVVGGADSADTRGFFVYGDGYFVLDHGALVGLALYTDSDPEVAYLGSNVFGAGYDSWVGESPPRWGGVWSLDGGGVAPEPGVWAMLLLGFGALGAALRRSRAMGRPVAG